MGFKFDQQSINAHSLKFTVELESDPVDFKLAINLLLDSSDFRIELSRILWEVQFEGCFWEVKPVTLHTIHEEFEFVVIKTNGFLNLKADPHVFKKYFDSNML